MHRRTLTFTLSIATAAILAASSALAQGILIDQENGERLRLVRLPNAVFEAPISPEINGGSTLSVIATERGVFIGALKFKKNLLLTFNPAFLTFDQAEGSLFIETDELGNFAKIYSRNQDPYPIRGDFIVKLGEIDVVYQSRYGHLVVSKRRELEGGEAFVVGVGLIAQPQTGEPPRFAWMTNRFELFSLLKPLLDLAPYKLTAQGRFRIGKDLLPLKTHIGVSIIPDPNSCIAEGNNSTRIIFQEEYQKIRSEPPNVAKKHLREILRREENLNFLSKIIILQSDDKAKRSIGLNIEDNEIYSLRAIGNICIVDKV